MATTELPQTRAPGPLFGRHDTADELTRLLHTRSDGAGGLLVVVGEGGVGKSTMLRTGAETARGLGFTVLMGRSLPAEVPPPFGLIADVLRSAQHERSEREIASLAGTSALPLFLAPYDRTPPAHPEGSASAEPAEVDEANRLLARILSPTERIEANRASLFENLAEYFRELGRQRPLLLVLDDLHLADDSSLEFLRSFLSATPPSPVVVLASTVPPEEVPPRAAPALDALLRRPGVVSLPLRPMTEAEVALFVRWILNGRDPGGDAIMRWFTQTEGNPLFVEHLVRASMGFGTVTASPVGKEQGLEEVLLSRVRALGEADRRVLVHASVLGKEFRFRALAVASGLEEERLSEALDRLVHAGLLRERGGEVYEFVSERARAGVYAELTETRRRILHRKVARALEGDPGTQTDPFELARQFYLGRDDAKALEYNRRSAGLAAEAYALDTAVIYLERALECARRLEPRDPAGELRLLVELGRFLGDTGDLHRSEVVLLDAVARARADPAHASELALALLGLAQTRSDLAHYASSRELATEAFGLLGRLGNERGLLVAHRILGVASWRLGDLAEAERQQRAAIEISERVGTPAERGHALIDLANTIVQAGKPRVNEGLELYQRAATLLTEGRDHSARARVLMNRALLYHHENRMAEAVADMEEAVRAAEAARSRIWTGYCQLNLAQFRVELGEGPAATTALDRAVQLLEPAGDQLALQQATMIRGMIREAEGDLRGAEPLYLEALNRAKELGLGPEVAEMHYRLAELEARRGELSGARRWLEGALAAGILTLRGDLTTPVEELRRRLAAPSGGAR